MNLISSMLTAFTMYTRINFPHKDFAKTDSRYLIMGMIPVGFFIGVIWWFVYSLLAVFDIPAMVLAAVMSVFPHWFSGYIHLEGYMDMSAEIIARQRGQGNDGKNSLNVISLAVLMLIQFAAFYQFVTTSQEPLMLLFVPIFSRELAAMLIFMMPTFMGNGTSKSIAECTIILVLLILATVIACIVTIGMRGALLIISMLIGFILPSVVAMRSKLPGGDTAGYSLTLSETIGFVALAIIY